MMNIMTKVNFVKNVLYQLLIVLHVPVLLLVQNAFKFNVTKNFKKKKILSQIKYNYNVNYKTLLYIYIYFSSLLCKLYSKSMC